MGLLGGLGKLIGGAGTANPAMLGLGAAGSALQGIAGLFQSGAAKKKMKRLIDPGYNIPKEYAQNLAISENMAKEGMPTEQYNKGQQDINRAGTAGLRAISRSSNPAAGAASLLRGQTDALNNLNIANASARRQNILGAMGARRELAGQKLAQQQYRQQKYADEYNQLNAQRGAGAQNTFGGLSGLAQIGMYGNAYGKGTTPSQPGANPMSPSQMSMQSSYKTPSLTGLQSPTDIYGLGNTSGSMSLGSLGKPSRFSGFGFR